MVSLVEDKSFSVEVALCFYEERRATFERLVLAAPPLGDQRFWAVIHTGSAFLSSLLIRGELLAVGPFAWLEVCSGLCLSRLRFRQHILCLIVFRVEICMGVLGHIRSLTSVFGP